MAPAAASSVDQEVANAAPQANAPQQGILKSEKSRGEKIFDWSVYSGLNYWVNLGISIVIADYFNNKGGKPLLSKAADSIGKMLTKNPAKLASTTRHAETALETGSLLSGGWALLVPMKVLEDNKRPIVHWLNDKLGIDQTAPDGHKETPDEIYIECEQPKQSWLNVIKRRIIAAVAVMGTGSVLNAALRDREKTAQWQNSAAYNPRQDPHGGKKRTEDFIVNAVDKGMRSGVVPHGETIANNDTFRRLLGLAALDSIFTKITAVIMHVTNGAVKAQMPNEIGDDAAPNVILEEKNRIHTIPDPQPISPEHAVSASATANAILNPAPKRPKIFEPLSRYVQKQEEPSEALDPERFKKATILQRSIHPSKVNEQGESSAISLTP